ncbi:helix-turn-helix domain-containing protein [Bacillus horti]|uniref:AraC-like DNA-binding protein n=1 Tax=Caldalkalibacillus horti TaxID=77523 RepID=A0ABT9VWI1_9BACI|nr:AraC family transcriptional regulator [Bacillus horti]MDQ0165355.1 AraC-like DNA-binding protein [Bacillus horti]
MIFKMHTPQHKEVSQYIKEIWYISQNGEDVLGMNPKMIPGGYYHMVINLGSPHFYMDRNGKSFSPKASHINAKQNEYVTIQRKGHVEIMGIVFRPYGLYALVNMPVSELVGTVQNMEELIGNRIGELEEQLASVTGIQEKFMLLERRLHEWISIDKPIKEEIRFAVDMIVKHKGSVSLKQVQEYVNLSERSLERYFKAYTGISPKQFSDIHRLQFALDLMRDNSDKLVNHALFAGYYDQAHFNRSFTKMVGSTPKEYLTSRNLLSDLYKK